MELLKANFLNTTTQMTVDSNTAVAANLFNPDRQLQYFSDGYANDLTTTTIRISFDQTTTVGRIALLEHNLKSFLIYYNGATASTFGLSADTTVSNYISNSQTSNYLNITTPVACTSVSIDCKKTIAADNEKAIGVLVLSAVDFDFTRIPNSDGYTPVLNPKQIVHTLSDGGTRVHTIQDKWNATIKYKNLDQTMRDSLRTIYNQYLPHVFVPFGTSTGWDGILFESVWVGPFDFYKYSDNAVSSGYTGSINLKETSN